MRGELTLCQGGASIGGVRVYVLRRVLLTNVGYVLESEGGDHRQQQRELAIPVRH
jgi:hypothetical protein